MSDSKQFWVGFSFVKGIGAVRFQTLIDTFGSAEAAWNAPQAALRETGLSQKVIENLIQTRNKISLEKTWEKIQSLGIQVLTVKDAEYPTRLKEILQPPPVLYVRGNVLSQDDLAVAVVGTRRMTVYGRQVTEDIARLLATSGVTVVSGLARGIDGIAHQTALDAGGRTLAVLGSGVDLVYPPEHRKLAEQILENGALISDYAPGTPPDAVNFPPRNRLISGLSVAVVIVEAGKTSGALITAQFAADQSRDVFAVPGNINAPQSLGPNRLIRDGAIPLIHPQNLLESLNLVQAPEFQAARTFFPQNPQEARLLQILSSEPVHVDEITHLTGMQIEEVSATLTMMELKGMVRQVGGMHYITAREMPSSYDV